VKPNPSCGAQNIQPQAHFATSGNKHHTKYWKLQFGFKIVLELKFKKKVFVKIVDTFKKISLADIPFCILASVAEPEPQGAARSRNF
jgi:hypothetical protein